MLSKHGKQRLKSRVTNSLRIIKKVIEEGRPVHHFTGDLRDFLEMKNCNILNKDKILRLYNQSIFVFDSRLTLVTTLNLSGSLLNSYNKQLKKMA